METYSSELSTGKLELTGVSFDISYIDGYKNFTVDNFFIKPTGFYADYKYETNSDDVSRIGIMDYDSNTGIFKIAMGRFANANDYFTMSGEVYLIK